MSPERCNQRTLVLDEKQIALLCKDALIYQLGIAFSCETLLFGTMHAEYRKCSLMNKYKILIKSLTDKYVHSFRIKRDLYPCTPGNVVCAAYYYTSQISATFSLS